MIEALAFTALMLTIKGGPIPFFTIMTALAAYGWWEIKTDRTTE